MEQPSIASLIQKNQTQTNYNWVGVLEFLHEQHKGIQYKECEQALEKSEMQAKIKELEGIAQGLEKVVTDLGRRAKMLEVALRQERLKNQRLSNGQSLAGMPDMVGQLLQENIDNTNNLQTVPKRKARPYRPLLQKILSEIGIQQIFSPPGSPRAENANSSNRPSAVLQTPLENKSGRQSPSRENLNSTSGFPNFVQPQHRRVQQMTPSDQEEPMKMVTSLRSHLDGVRDAYFFPNVPVMASVSEDCQIKFWDTRSLNEEVQPYLSLREHTGPIFAVSGFEINKQRAQQQNQYIVLSAGSEGMIKAWNVPFSDDVDTLGPTESYQRCLSSWNAHNDAIWQLAVNPFENLLLSSAADGIIKLWQLADILNEEEEPKQLMAYGQRNQYGQYVDIPTGITWLTYNYSQLACGYENGQFIHVFDCETGKTLTTLKFSGDNSTDNQLNKIICHPNQQMLISAHEDGKIKLFDLNASIILTTIPFLDKQQSNVNVHNSSVSSIALNNSSTLIYTASHDGVVKAWDIRRLQCLQELKMPNFKYDESIHNLVHHPTQNLLAICGADSTISVFSTKT